MIGNGLWVNVKTIKLPMVEFSVQISIDLF